MRYLSGDLHPDHDTICTFRVKNEPLIKQAFTSILLLAKELKFLKVGNVSIDGTKVLANASKHKAVSYNRAGEQIEVFQAEVAELLQKAEQADKANLAEGLTIPQEIKRREDRIEKLRQARQVIEERVKEHVAQLQEEHELKMKERAAKKEQGKRVSGREPKPPSDTPSGREQYNFTDPESRIMKMGNGKRFEQCYNAQAAVDADGSMLILGARVCASANDKQQLIPTAQTVNKDIGSPNRWIVDSGYYSEKAVKQTEESLGALVYAAVGKQSHHRSVRDLQAHVEPAELPQDAKPLDVMAHRLQTKEGKAVYKLRKETVEPVFGIIKEVLGFRRFMLRGLEKVNLEWSLVSLAYNFKKIFALSVRAAA
jgi:transposase